VSDVLQKVYAAKAAWLEQERVAEPYDALRKRALESVRGRRPFLEALKCAQGGAIVAEVKRASPSAGLIARSFDPVAIAQTYDRAGCDAISVLTERDHFLGDLAHLEMVRAATARPLLRKDFLWTRYHVAQSAAHGADCALLIVAGLDDHALSECMVEAREYALDVLVEVHDVVDLQRALQAGAQLVGINNRNLRTLETDLAVSEHLLPQVPPYVFAISESGMRDASDVARLRAAGARGYLIGEALMNAPNPSQLIESLRRGAAGMAPTPQPGSIT
jgi:indole-3-glycerol phosphate synthase